MSVDRLPVFVLLLSGADGFHLDVQFSVSFSFSDLKDLKQLYNIFQKVA